MAEDLFRNSSTSVPDEIWKGNQTPMQRQLAAVEFWDEMNGRKRASAEEDRKRRRNTIQGAVAGGVGMPAGFLAAAALDAKRRGFKHEPMILVPAAAAAGVGALVGGAIGQSKSVKQASYKQTAQRLAQAIAENPELAGAGISGTITGARSLYDSGGVGPTGRSRGESDLLASIAQRQQMHKDRGSSPGIRDRLLAKQLEIAEYDRKNRAVAALRDAAIGAGIGAGVGHGARHLDKLGPFRQAYGGA